MSYDYEQLLDDDLAYSIVEAISEGKIEPVRLTARDYLNGRRTTKSHHLAYHLCVLYGMDPDPDPILADYWAEQCLASPDCTPRYRHMIAREPIKRWLRSGSIDDTETFISAAQQLYAQGFQRHPRPYDQLAEDALLFAKVFLRIGSSCDVTEYLTKAENIIYFVNVEDQPTILSQASRLRIFHHALSGERRACRKAIKKYLGIIARLNPPHLPEKYIRDLKMCTLIGTKEILSDIAQENLAQAYA